MEMAINGVVEIVMRQASSLSAGDIIAIIVASISLIGVIVSTVMTNRTTKNIDDSNKQFQDKWNQKKIDASLIASARIEWIQKVRNTTAKSIALYFQALNTVDKLDLLDIVIKAQEKTELLILFFEHEENETADQNVDLCCTANNDGKNHLIVNFLSSLSKKLNRYYENLKSDKLKDLKFVKDKRYSEMSEHVINYDYEEYTDEYDITKINQTPILDEEYQESLNDIDKQIDVLVKISKDINSDLLMLRDIIRIYLKIEWSKAKTGV